MSQETLVTLLSQTGKSLKQIQGEPATTNSEKKRKLFARLRRSGKKLRAAFVEREIAVSVPFQIKGMRERAGLTQEQLAALTQKRQSVISQVESPGYGKLTLKTLRTIAEAFDVGLMVRFVPFSELVERAIDVSESSHKVPDIENDHPTFAAETSSSEAGYIDIANTAPVLRLISNRGERIAAKSISHITTRNTTEEIAHGGST